MNIALILSGGTGVRLGGDIPKQYIQAGRLPIIAYCLKTLAENGRVDAIHLVVESGWRAFVMEVLEKVGAGEKHRGFSEPGASRQLSIWNALQDIRAYAADNDVVLIHDAARPMLSQALIDVCLEQLNGHDGVMPVLPMKDTVYYSEDGGSVTRLLNRGCVFAGQAPEAFFFSRYYAANQRLLPERILGIRGSAEPAVLAGQDIVMIPGDEANFKITTKGDLARFRMLVERDKG